MLYPFSIDLLPLIQSIEQLGTIDHITKLVCPTSWMNKIGDFKGQQITTAFDDALQGVDGVIFSDCSKHSWLYMDIVKKITSCVKARKEVICCTEIKTKDLKAIQTLSTEYKINFKYLAGSEPDIKVSDSRHLSREDCIVIGIGKLLYNVDNTSSFCRMYSHLTQKGYKVVGIGDNANYKLINCFRFPKLIFESECTEENKVLYINAYVNTLQRLYSADIILIHFPDGMLKYSDDCFEEFGIRSFITSQALNIDYFVLNMPIEEFSGESFLELSKTFKYRFDFEIDAVCLESKVVDVAKSIEEEKVCYHFISEKDVEEYIAMCKSECTSVKFCSSKSITIGEEFADDCISKLSGNVEEF